MKHKILSQLRTVTKEQLKGGLAALAFLLLVGIYYWLNLPSTLPIQTIKINASYQRVSREKIQKICMPYVIAGFFGFPAEKLSQALLAEPWIAQVALTRLFPDSIDISIIEQKPVARWGEKGLFNAKGEVFYPKTYFNAPKAMPYLLGPQERSLEVFQEYQKMRKMLGKIGRTILTVEVSGRLAWQLRLDNGILLMLGKGEPMTYLARFIRIYPKAFGSHGNEIERVDMRYTSGMAVTWRDGKRSRG